MGVRTVLKIWTADQTAGRCSADRRFNLPPAHHAGTFPGSDQRAFVVHGAEGWMSHTARTFTVLDVRPGSVKAKCADLRIRARSVRCSEPRGGTPQPMRVRWRRARGPSGMGPQGRVGVAPRWRWKSSAASAIRRWRGDGHQAIDSGERAGACPLAAFGQGAGVMIAISASNGGIDRARSAASQARISGLSGARVSPTCRHYNTESAHSPHRGSETQIARGGAASNRGDEDVGRARRTYARRCGCVAILTEPAASTGRSKISRGCSRAAPRATGHATRIRSCIPGARRPIAGAVAAGSIRMLPKRSSSHRRCARAELVVLLKPSMRRPRCTCALERAAPQGLLMVGVIHATRATQVVPEARPLA